MIRSIFFDDGSLDESNVSLYLGVFGFFIIALVFAIPSDEQGVQLFFPLYLVSLCIFGTILVLVLLLVKLLGGNLRTCMLKSTFYLMLSLIIVDVPAFLITHLLFQQVFALDILAKALFIIIPYYNYVLFGWLIERTSDLEGWKGIAVALFAIAMITSYPQIFLVLHNLLI